MLSGREPIAVPARGCKYISGDPKQGEWSYCGNELVEANSSWCAEHHAVVYGLPKPKPEQKPDAEAKPTLEIAAPVAGLEDPMLLG